MRKSKFLSLLLAVAVMATMLVAVPLTASAEDSLAPAVPQNAVRVEAESKTEGSRSSGGPIENQDQLTKCGADKASGGNVLDNFKIAQILYNHDAVGNTFDLTNAVAFNFYACNWNANSNPSVTIYATTKSTFDDAQSDTDKILLANGVLQCNTGQNYPGDYRNNYIAIDSDQTLDSTYNLYLEFTAENNGYTGRIDFIDIYYKNSNLEKQIHNVKIGDHTNFYSVTPSATKAVAGQQVSVTYSASDGYVLDKLQYTPQSGEEAQPITAPENDQRMQFTMPDEDVTITAIAKTGSKIVVSDDYTFGGSVSFSPEFGSAGDTITLTASFFEGFGDVDYNIADGISVTKNPDSKTATFTIPESAPATITIKPTFKPALKNTDIVHLATAVLTEGNHGGGCRIDSGDTKDVNTSSTIGWTSSSGGVDYVTFSEVDLRHASYIDIVTETNYMDKSKITVYDGSFNTTTNTDRNVEVGAGSTVLGEYNTYNLKEGAGEPLKSNMSIGGKSCNIYRIYLTQKDGILPGMSLTFTSGVEENPNSFFGNYYYAIINKTPQAFGNYATDAGYYYEDNEKGVGDKLGVIRYLQEYTGGEPSEYGFYFFDKDGNFLKTDTYQLKGNVDYTGSGGISGDLVDIPEGNFKYTYYAKAYVVVDGVTYFADSIGGQVQSGGVEPKWVEDPTPEQ